MFFAFIFIQTIKRKVITSSLYTFLDSSKKRRKIRLKISRQKESLKSLVTVYNENISCHQDLNHLRKVAQQSFLQSHFPWRQVAADEANGVICIFLSLLLICLTGYYGMIMLTKTQCLLFFDPDNYPLLLAT